ncbi:neuron navigator 1 isoform X3 [Esox lucius]|uniref:neuron navigator 1 isoform X3 n=1 Tax=Esox lucius TaxID=8010 RepID=UPI001476C310|nr:neuron navigator 1 isoform X3 [Esox lucius]
MLDANISTGAKSPTGGQPDMTSRRGIKPPSLPQAISVHSGPELRVYCPGSNHNPSILRKQRSLTNLCVLTDTEKKFHLYQAPSWTDDMDRPTTGISKKGRFNKGRVGMGEQGKASLTRSLSKSEQSLFHRSKPLSPSAMACVPKPGIKPSRIPRGPSTEGKGKAPKEGNCNQKAPLVENILQDQDKRNSTGASDGRAGERSSWTSQSVEERRKRNEGDVEEQEKGFLKVDPELVVTVLGDLEQLLFNHMLDPETQRKRTVQNVLDLRQNLEDTMSCLRGDTLRHRCLNGGVSYDSDDVTTYSVSSQSDHFSPLSWRQGQASPRLQAGDAPSTVHTQSHDHTHLGHFHGIQLLEELDDADPSHLKSGYLSNTDLGGNSTEDDPVNGWDESSSISSGLSDGSDNLSSEEFNVSPTLNSLPTTLVGPRRNSTIVLRTDTEKRLESSLSWDSDDVSSSVTKSPSQSYDTNSLKTRPQGEGLEPRGQLKKPHTLRPSNGALKKRRNLPVGISSPVTHVSTRGLKVTGVPSDKYELAVRSSGLQRSCSDAGNGKEHKGGASDPCKPPLGVARSAQPPTTPSQTRPSSATPSTGSFGYRKPGVSMASGSRSSTSMVTPSGGVAISSGKTCKSSSIPVKPSVVGVNVGRKTSLDVTRTDHTSFTSPNARNNVQYRSLPRPAKTTLSTPGGRPVSSIIDNSRSGNPSPTQQYCLKPSNPSPTQQYCLKPSNPSPTQQGSRMKEPGSGLGMGGLGKAGRHGGIPSSSPSLLPSPSSRSNSIGVNQTDREKERAKAIAGKIGGMDGEALWTREERARVEAAELESECVKAGPPQKTAEEKGGQMIGLRTGGRACELPSPKTHRMSGVRTLGKPSSTPLQDSLTSFPNMNSNPNLTSYPNLTSNPDGLEPQAPFSLSVPPYSSTPTLTPSPAPLLNVNSSACFSSSALGGTGGPGVLGQRQGSVIGVESGGSPLIYPRLSGLHRSMESLPLQMSLAPETPSDTEGAAYPGTEPRDQDGQQDKGPDGWSSGSTAPFTLIDSCSGPSQTVERREERRHSHTIMTPPALLPSPSSLPRTKTNTVPPPLYAAPPRMTRSNSIPIHDASLELYRATTLGSCLSLSDRPRSLGMVRSGSFRESHSIDEVHGSALSLASDSSSTYSSVSVPGMQYQAEERIQGEQIRKLRRELASSQEKVANLTTQLSANANLVAAFEQSLALMTTRLQSLSVSQEQKDSELLAMKETIDALKTKNEEAQAVIHVALNNPDTAPSDLHMHRQNSCESLSSLSSLGSLSMKDQDSKKKKKKNWLRTSFSKAFKKGSKSGTLYSDIEEISTPNSSTPSSPKLPHNGGEGANTLLSQKTSLSAASSVIFEGEEPDGEERVVSELRSELWEKEMKLTDIRLEALNSAHQLEQLRDAMNNMQSTVENLKAENDKLKGSPAPVPSSRPPTSTSQPSGLAGLLGASPRQPVSMSLTNSISLNDCDIDRFPVDVRIVSFLHEEVCMSSSEEALVSVLVHIEDHSVPEDKHPQQDLHYLGSVQLSGRTGWLELDTLVNNTFMDYISQVDPTASLGLSIDSLHSYQLPLGGQRVLGGDVPQILPSCCLGNGPARIIVTLKGLKEQSVDSLVFDLLIPKPMMQHYISLLLKHRRLVLSGPSGTGKSHLATRLARYLLLNHNLSPPHDLSLRGQREVVTFNMHHQSHKELQLYLSDVATQIEHQIGGKLPLVVILDDISDAASVSELVNGALTCKYHHCPYIIGTTNQPVKMSPNHGLHLSFRIVTFSNNVEPANGFLVRYLHRKAVEAQPHQPHPPSPQQKEMERQVLLRVLDWVPQLWYHLHTFLEKHGTSDFLIGPCFFLSCPVTIAEFRPWFIDLWNHSIIPYLQEGARDGLKVHGLKAAWEDPVEWVRGSLPWPDAQEDQAQLFHLPPPNPTLSWVNTAPTSPNPGLNGRQLEDSPLPCPVHTDPLMAMLLKLQESANCIESPEQDLAPSMLH